MHVLLLLAIHLLTGALLRIQSVPRECRHSSMSFIVVQANTAMTLPTGSPFYHLNICLILLMQGQFISRKIMMIKRTMKRKTIECD